MLCTMSELTTPKYCKALGCFEFNHGACHAAAVEDMFDALRSCYGDRVISLQQLSATFRRGDLLEMLGIDGGETDG